MPHFFPSIDPAGIENDGERAVAIALQQQLAPDAWVFHSYPWLRRGRDVEGAGNDFGLREGEADFVVVDPRLGLAVLEVKGGTVLREESGRWYRQHAGRREYLKRSPFEQARVNLHALCGLLWPPNKPGAPVVAYGYAAVFPHMRHVGQAPPGADPAVVLDGPAVEQIGRRLSAAMTAWDRRPADRRRPLDASAFKQLRQAVARQFDLVEWPAAHIHRDERLLVRLTDQQAEFCAGLFETRRMAVRGVAGSGKTCLALLRAKQFAREDGRTLFLCYTAELAQWAAEQISGDPDPAVQRIATRTFHAWAREVITAAGRTFRVPDAPDAAARYFQEELPELLLDVLQAPPPRAEALLDWRAVVVDEAQDFHGLWWTVIEALLERSAEAPVQANQAEPGLYLFYDPDQNVFDGTSEFPKTSFRHTLSVNCRNTREIAAFCGRVLNKSVQASVGAPKGEAVQLITEPSFEARVARCLELVEAWITDHGLKPTQIAVLTRHRATVDAVVSATSTRGVPKVKLAAEWRQGRGALVTTAAAFKGLEADLVILMDLPSSEPSSKNAVNRQLYVAGSRAKHRLIVIE